MIESSWRDRAACKGSDPALFFPVNGDFAGSMAAKSICRACPVQEECAAYNLSMPAHLAKHGVWGGRTEKQRRQTRREARAS